MYEPLQDRALMSLQKIASLLESGLPGCEVLVTGDPSGSHIEVSVIGELFSGMNKVKRQQRVYALLKDMIADGSVHAVTMQTFTPDERSQA